MPARKDVVFFCSDCGHESTKWLGQCPGCGSWNSFVEEPRAAKAKTGRKGSPLAARGAAAVPVTDAAATLTERVPTGLDGVDRVLGGGLVPGSLVLVSGEPGVGKSTLLLQVAAAAAAAKGTVVYVTGEESSEQVALRARRIGGLEPELLLLPETSCESVMTRLEQLSPALVVVDSIQTMTSEEVDAVAGSVSQVRQAASRFQHLAKTRAVPVILVGHVTKEGHIAGPKLLEHLVDVVLSLEGEPGHDLRVLRAGKNRFGTVAELALWSMTGTGLESVRNPSAWLLEDRRRDVPGSVVAAALEGTAPLLVEIQALATPSTLGTPRRVAHGFDSSRLALLLAVVERHAGIRLTERDVFLNLVGGLSLREPALDLAVAAALVSSAADRPLPTDLAVFGEIGLLGEVRAVSRTAERVREAAALGFERVALPARDAAAELPLATVRINSVADLVGLLG
ncbi:MAG: DNA repair protein RadA [Thermoanaerobaculales bacterium]|jgi:DNA repair protein RadA/Sms|nr:DNA repair protein RadA [Thermoanaerobaculales bacterium]